MQFFYYIDQLRVCKKLRTRIYVRTHAYIFVHACVCACVCVLTCFVCLNIFPVMLWTGVFFFFLMQPYDLISMLIQTCFIIWMRVSMYVAGICTLRVLIQAERILLSIFIIKTRLNQQTFGEHFFNQGDSAKGPPIPLLRSQPKYHNMLWVASTVSLLIYLLYNLHHFAKRISFLTIFLGTQICHLLASMVIISTLSHIHIQMVHCTFVHGLLPTRILGKANSFLIIASIIGQGYLLYSSGLFFLVFTSSLLFYFWEGWTNFNGID